VGNEENAYSVSDPKNQRQMLLGIPAMPKKIPSKKKSCTKALKKLWRRY
jgi:hypothetical protein